MVRKQIFQSFRHHSTRKKNSRGSVTLASLIWLSKFLQAHWPWLIHSKRGLKIDESFSATKSSDSIVRRPINNSPRLRTTNGKQYIFPGSDFYALVLASRVDKSKHFSKPNHGALRRNLFYAWYDWDEELDKERVRPGREEGEEINRG